jgi:hypothetical protein
MPEIRSTIVSMGSRNLDIRGEGEGPITTVLFPDDY